MFLVQNLDKLVICHTAAGHSNQNHVEYVYAITNLGLRSIGLMRQRMSTEMEQLIKTKLILLRSSAKLLIIVMVS